MLKDEEEPHFKLGGGPLGLGDPNDKTLRKIERDVIVEKMLKEEAQKRCEDTLKDFHSCAKEAGLRITWKCQEEHRKNNDCLLQWLKNPQFIEEITNKYLEARSHYRITGEPLIKYERKKISRSGFC